MLALVSYQSARWCVMARWILLMGVLVSLGSAARYFQLPCPKPYTLPALAAQPPAAHTLIRIEGTPAAEPRWYSATPCPDILTQAEDLIPVDPQQGLPLEGPHAIAPAKWPTLIGRYVRADTVVLATMPYEGRIQFEGIGVDTRQLLVRLKAQDDLWAISPRQASVAGWRGPFAPPEVQYSEEEWKWLNQ